jgi:hypothetical protein
MIVVVVDVVPPAVVEVSNDYLAVRKCPKIVECSWDE